MPYYIYFSKYENHGMLALDSLDQGAGRYTHDTLIQGNTYTIH